MFKKDAQYFAEGSKEFYQRLILGILETYYFWNYPFFKISTFWNGDFENFLVENPHFLKIFLKIFHQNDKIQFFGYFR